MIHLLYNFYLTRFKKHKKNLIVKKIQWKLYKYLQNNLEVYYEKINVKPITKQRQKPLVVSLTSFGERIDKVHLAIKSMFNQSCKPDKIILWLGKDEFQNGVDDLPETLSNLLDKGLVIEFCEDIESHTKYYYAFKKHQNDLVVTIDDDLIYPKNMLQILIKYHRKFPNSVIANRVRELKFTNGNINEYRSWKINEYENSSPSMKLLATGVGGVLYQPHYFTNEVFKIENIKMLSYYADDIWLKANQIISNVPVVFTRYFYNPFVEIKTTDYQTLHESNVFLGGNDEQIAKVFSFYNINESSFN